MNETTLNIAKNLIKKFVGVGAFKKSTFLKRLNEGEFREAANEMLRWSYVKNHEAAGLLKRRQIESVLLYGF